jgi:ferredoxin-fold anticodon binding domain-containing protein
MKPVIHAGIILAYFFLGCNNSKPNIKVNSESRILSKITYTDLTLKETDISAFFHSFPEEETIVNEVNLFYKIC